MSLRRPTMCCSHLRQGSHLQVHTPVLHTHRTQLVCEKRYNRTSFLRHKTTGLYAGDLVVYVSYLATWNVIQKGHMSQYSRQAISVHRGTPLSEQVLHWKRKRQWWSINLKQKPKYLLSSIGSLLTNKICRQISPHHVLQPSPAGKVSPGSYCCPSYSQNTASVLKRQ